MLPRLDASGAGLAPLPPAHGAAPAEPVGDARQEAFARSLRGMLGQSMRGEVLARMNDGSFLVKVAGTSARMLLPGGAQVGGEVPLTLVALDPRPTFQVGAERSAAVTVALAHGGEAQAEALAAHAQGQTQTRAAAPASLAAALLGKAPLTPADLLPGFDPAAPAPQLSETARAIASMLTQAGAAPAALVGKTALLAAPPAGAEPLAQALQQALGHSGLFYESHVAEWAAGQRSLLDLAREPQMRQGGGAEAEQAAARLVNLQLQTQEQGRVAWQGEVWPGQQMAWQVQREQPEAGQRGDPGQDEEPDEPAWRSSVRFEFAGLGAVSATLLLSGGTLRIALAAGSQQAAGALRAHAGALEAALAAAGAPLAALQIGQPGERIDGA